MTSLDINTAPEGRGLFLSLLACSLLIDSPTSIWVKFGENMMSSQTWSQMGPRLYGPKIFPTQICQFHGSTRRTEGVLAVVSTRSLPSPSSPPVNWSATSQLVEGGPVNWSRRSTGRRNGGPGDLHLFPPAKYIPGTQSTPTFHRTLGQLVDGGVRGLRGWSRVSLGAASGYTSA